MSKVKNICAASSNANGALTASDVITEHSVLKTCAFSADTEVHLSCPPVGLCLRGDTSFCLLYSATASKLNKKHTSCCLFVMFTSILMIHDSFHIGAFVILHFLTHLFPALQLETGQDNLTLTRDSKLYQHQKPETLGWMIRIPCFWLAAHSS